MTDTTTPIATITWSQAWWTWARVAVLSFGGPAGQIAVMHRIIVDEKRWLTEERFLHALNFCMLLPGPEAQQLATYIGWLLHGARGGLLAGGLFILPGFLSILALSLVYATFRETTVIAAIFFGLKPAVLAIVVDAVVRISTRVLRNRVMVVVAVAAFLLLFFFQAPFPAIIAAAGLLGAWGGRFTPQTFAILQGHGGNQVAKALTLAPGVEQLLEKRARIAPTWSRALRISAIALPLWFGPLLAVSLSLGPQSVLFQQGVFFSKAAVVTFGGAYSVLAYVAQQAVDRFEWLNSAEMLDGLGMAETTPGPLIMVLQFVAFLGAWRNPAPLSPLAAALVASVLTTWVTFVPCFYWIFLGAPWVERLRANASLTAALSTITAAVVGVVANLSVWFALHTFFAQVDTQHFGWLRLLVPQWHAVSLGAMALCLLAIVLTFVRRQNVFVVLAVCTVIGTVLHQWS